MAVYERFDAARHGAWSCVRTDLSWLHTCQVIPLACREAGLAALDMPLAFRREGPWLSLVAVLGLEVGRAAYIGPKGRWRSGYVPVWVRAYPFGLCREAQSTALRLGLHAASPWLQQHADAPLITPEGALSEFAQKRVQWLRQSGWGSAPERALLQAIDAANVLEPWDEAGPDLCRVVDWLWRNLPALQLETLHRTGALDVLVAQRLSVPRLERVREWSSVQQPQFQPQRRAATPAPSIDVSGDTIRFG